MTLTTLNDLFTSLPWYFLAFIPTFTWAAANFLDQFIAREYFPRRSYALVGALSITFAANALLLMIFCDGLFDISFINAFGIFMAGVFFAASFIPYIMAIQDRDASLAIPIFQSVPFFTLILGAIILGQVFSKIDMLAGLIIILAAAAMQLDVKKLTDKSSVKLGRKLHIKPFLLMILASLLVALYVFILDIFAGDTPLLTVCFWILLGEFIVTAIILFAKPDRTRIVLQAITSSKGTLLFWTSIAQILSFSATFSLTVAVTAAPSGTHVMLVNGLQPTTVLFMGLGLAYFFPHISDENKLDRQFLYRLICVAIILGALYLLISQ